MTRRTLAAAALTALLVVGVRQLTGGLIAARAFDGDATAILPLARHVADLCDVGIAPEDYRFLGAPFDGEWALVTNQMAVIGLAQTLAAAPHLQGELLPSLRRCSDRLVDPRWRAFATAETGEDAFTALDGDQGHAWLGYPVLALGLHRAVDPDFAHAALHDRLADGLARRLGWPVPALQTYPGERYPPDMAAVAAAVAVHRRITGAPHPELDDWLSRLDQMIDPETGLAVQTVDARGVRGLPRGSGSAFVAWLVGYADRERAAPIWAAIRRELWVDVAGHGALREHPRGVRLPGDIDSGPVILGLSTSATGFAIGAARSQGDRDAAIRLGRTAHLAGLPISTGSRRRYLTGTAIGNALMLALQTTPRGAEVGDGDS